MKEHCSLPLCGNVTTILPPFKEDTKILAKEIDLAAHGDCVAAQASEHRTLIIPSINWGTPEECAALREAYLKAGSDTISLR